jgi:hypothetical protein
MAKRKEMMACFILTAFIYSMSTEFAYCKIDPYKVYSLAVFIIIAITWF